MTKGHFLQSKEPFPAKRKRAHPSDAVCNDLKYMCYVLNVKQHSKHEQLVNVTLRNRGLIKQSRQEATTKEEGNKEK